MRQNHKRSICPVACTLDIVGDKWTLLVVRDLLRGVSHFGDFGQSPEGIATNILAERLKRLVVHKLAETYPSPHRPGRVAYRLTDRGRTLEPVLRAVAEWGLANIPGTEARLTPSAAVGEYSPRQANCTATPPPRGGLRALLPRTSAKK